MRPEFGNCRRRPTTVQCSEGIWTGKCSFFWKSQLHTPRDILFSVESILLGKIVSGAIFRRGYLNWELQVQIFKKSATHASWRQFSNLVSCHCTVLNVFWGVKSRFSPLYWVFLCCFNWFKLDWNLKLHNASMSLPSLKIIASFSIGLWLDLRLPLK